MDDERDKTTKDERVKVDKDGRHRFPKENNPFSVKFRDMQTHAIFPPARRKK